jgi:hypothetical protein
MASAFKNYYTQNIGTGNTSIFTGTGGAQTTVIGLTMSNIFTQPIEASLFLSVGGANTYIIKDATIPKGGALVPVGGDQKLVIEAGDVLYVNSNTASSVDVVISTLEIT